MDSPLTSVALLLPISGQVVHPMVPIARAIGAHWHSRCCRSSMMVRQVPGVRPVHVAGARQIASWRLRGKLSGKGGFGLTDRDWRGIGNVRLSRFGQWSRASNFS